jgi:hypothetical protein
VQTTRRGWLAALHYRDFRLLLIGEVTSAIGTEMLYVSLSWQMYLLTHSALALGLLGLAGFIPALLFSLLGGNFADAHNRKKILYITQPIFMLCSILLALATPDTMRGRVASIAMIFWMGGPQLGEFQAGLLAALIGVQFSVVAGGVVTIVFVGIMALLVPALRKYQAVKYT